MNSSCIAAISTPPGKGGVVGFPDDYGIEPEQPLIGMDIDRQQRTARPQGQHDRAGLAGDPLLPDPGSLGEDQQFFPAFQGFHGLLDRIDVPFAPLNANHADPAKQVFQQWHMHQLILGHNPEQPGRP